MREPLETVTEAGHRLGDYIREQRRGSQISLRQLAVLAGVSNPYLSQIERGLRKPSAEILQQIAKGLRISAEALYLQAGILEQREGDPAVAAAVLADPVLTERQKQVLLEVYESFRREVPAETAPPTPATAPTDVDPVGTPTGEGDPAPAPQRARQPVAGGAPAPARRTAAAPAAAPKAARRAPRTPPRPEAPVHAPQTQETAT